MIKPIIFLLNSVNNKPSECSSHRLIDDVFRSSLDLIIDLGNVVSYAISNGKIYYKIRNKSEKMVKKSMKLNGSNKKKSRYNVKMKGRKSNKKGYYINQVLTHTDPHNNYEYYTDYLVTPSGKRIALSNYMINLSDL